MEPKPLPHNPLPERGFHLGTHHAVFSGPFIAEEAMKWWGLIGLRRWKQLSQALHDSLPGPVLSPMELTGLGSNSFLLESDCAPRAGLQWEEGRETSPRFPVGDPVSVSSCEDHRGSACWFFSSELIVKTGRSVTCLQSWPLL